VSKPGVVSEQQNKDQEKAGAEMLEGYLVALFSLNGGQVQVAQAALEVAPVRVAQKDTARHQ
jgi:hypothetical protein